VADGRPNQLKFEIFDWLVALTVVAADASSRRLTGVVLVFLEEDLRGARLRAPTAAPTDLRVEREWLVNHERCSLHLRAHHIEWNSRAERAKIHLVIGKELALPGHELRDETVLDAKARPFVFRSE